MSSFQSCRKETELFRPAASRPVLMPMANVTKNLAKVCPVYLLWTQDTKRRRLRAGYMLGSHVLSTDTHP